MGPDTDLAESGVAEHVRKLCVAQCPGAEGLDLAVQARADPGNLGLRDAGIHAQGGDEVIDAAGGDPVDVGLHDHRVQRLVNAPAR
jgi:hypothetical protein